MNSVRRKRNIGWALIAVIGAAVLGPPATAHHSFPATYVKGEQVTIEGRLAAFMFRNPHSYVHVYVENGAGKTVRYAVEWGGAATLGKFGIDRATLKPGDFVVITGLPARNQADHRVLLRTIVRPSDGFKWGFEENETFN